MNNDEIVNQLMSLFLNDTNPMCTVSYLGRKLFGYNFDSNHDDYRRLLRILNRMEGDDILYSVSVKNGGNVYMLKRRDVRISDPFTYSTDLLGELPF